MSHGSYSAFLENIPSQRFKRGKEHPRLHRNHAQHRIMPQESPITQYECREEISLTVLIMILHELFELTAHILRAHVWRVRHHCRVFTCEVPCLGENLLHAFTQKRVKQRGFGFSIFCRCGKINKLLRRLSQRTVHIRLRIGIPYREVQIHLV